MYELLMVPPFRLESSQEFMLPSPPFIFSFRFRAQFASFFISHARTCCSKMAPRSPPSSAAARRTITTNTSSHTNPFRTLIDLQDALRTQSLYILDGSTAPGISNGTLAQDVPVGARSRRRGAGRGRGGGTVGGNDEAAAAATVAALSAASVAASSHSSSSATAPSFSAADLAGGRGYTAEAWEPTLTSMVDEQHVLAAKLRAILEEALERDIRENGARGEGVNASSASASNVSGGDQDERGTTTTAATTNEQPPWEQDIPGDPEGDMQQSKQQDNFMMVRVHRLRAAMEHAVEGGADPSEGAPNTSNQKDEPGPTLLQRHAHTVLQLLGLTEAIHGGYVLEDYAAPYLSRLARRQFQQSREVDGAVQMLREHRETLARETALAEAAARAVEEKGAVVGEDRAAAAAETTPWELPPSTERRSSSASSSRGASSRRVTADEYAKTYRFQSRCSGGRVAKASRTSAAAAAAGERQYEGAKRTKEKGKKRKTKQQQVAGDDGASSNANSGPRRERRHLEKTAEWDSILRQAGQQERQDQRQREKGEQMLEILRYQAMEKEAEDKAKARQQQPTGNESASLKRSADQIIQGSDDKDDLPIMQAHKAWKKSKYRFKHTPPPPPPPPSHTSEATSEELPTSNEAKCIGREASPAEAEPTTKSAGAAAAVPPAAPSTKSLPQHDLFAPSMLRDEFEPPQKQGLPFSEGSAAASAGTTFKAPMKPSPPPTSASNHVGRSPRKKAMKCHHCRNTTNQYRRCSYWKINGTQCRFVYCQTCLEDIYDHVSQNGPWEQCTSDKEWHCPCCLDNCQCKPCATKREKEEQRKMKMASSGFGDRGRRSRRGGGGPSDFALMF